MPHAAAELAFPVLGHGLMILGAAAFMLPAVHASRRVPEGRKAAQRAFCAAKLWLAAPVAEVGAEVHRDNQFRGATLW